MVYGKVFGLCVLSIVYQNYLMKQDRSAFYTLNHTFTSIPLRQKVNTASKPLQFYKHLHDPETAQLDQLQCGTNSEEMSTTWRPRLPCKKLYDDPNFFISVERRKHRVLNGLRNLSKFSNKMPEDKSMQGKKVKANSTYHKRGNRTFIIPAVEQRSGWEASNKVPHLTMNLQYLISKRKTMLTPQPQQKDFNLSQLSSTRFNESFRLK